MKIEMDSDTARCTENIAVFACGAAAICTVVYFVVVVWWVGLINIWHEEKRLRHEEERLKHETCFTEYGYEPALNHSYPTKSYCGENNVRTADAG